MLRELKMKMQKKTEEPTVVHETSDFKIIKRVDQELNQQRRMEMEKKKDL